jgi:hypothetical protein
MINNNVSQPVRKWLISGTMCNIELIADFPTLKQLYVFYSAELINTDISILLWSDNTPHMMSVEAQQVTGTTPWQSDPNALVRSQINSFRSVTKNGTQKFPKKSCPHRRKKPKIDLWEITGCAQIQEIERPGMMHFGNLFKCV